MTTNPSFQSEEYEIDLAKGFRIPHAKLDSGNTKNHNHLNLTIDNNSHAQDNSNAQLDLSEQKEKNEDYSLWSFVSHLGLAKNIEKLYEDVKQTKKIRKILKIIFYSILAVGYIAFLVAISLIRSDIEDEDYWCKGDGLFYVISVFVLILLLYFKVIKVLVKIYIGEILKNISGTIRKILELWYIQAIIYGAVFVGLVVFLEFDTRGERTRLLSFGGILCLICFGFIFSVAPRKVIWRQILWGMGLQFIFGLIILRWSVGRSIFSCFASKIQRFLEFTDTGSSFVFGELVTNEVSVFAFKVLSVILFFSLCVQILYYLGIMQVIVMKVGWLLQVTVGTSPCESINAAANIFLGMSEAPLIIKPYLPIMTKSELHAVLTGGFATIAGGVLAAYIRAGVDASHLLSASVMSAPAALAFSKLFYPEIETSRTKVKDLQFSRGNESNILHAALEGVIGAIPLVANIAANLVAFIAFINFADALVGWPCDLLGIEPGTCTFSNIFGYIFTPLAFIMGVPMNDCFNVGKLIGTKTIINEFVAYAELGELIKNKQMEKRAEIIATYALCGFSNITSIGIQLGAMGAMAPERKEHLSQIVVRAMIAGSIACFLTACVAGTLTSTL